MCRDAACPSSQLQVQPVSDAAMATDRVAGLDKARVAPVLLIERCSATCYTQVIEQPTGQGADIRAEMVQEHGVKKTVLAYEAADEFRIKQGMKRPIEARSVELNRAASQVSVEPSVRA